MPYERYGANSRILRRTHLVRPIGRFLAALEPRQLVSHDLHPRRRLRKADIHREKSDNRFQLVTTRAMLTRPTHMRPQPILDTTLRNQRRHNNKAADAQAETTALLPDPARRVDRFLTKPLPEPLCEPAENPLTRDLELTRVRIQSPVEPLRHRRSLWVEPLRHRRSLWGEPNQTFVAGSKPN